MVPNETTKFSNIPKKVYCQALKSLVVARGSRETVITVCTDCHCSHMIIFCCFVLFLNKLQ